MVVLHLRFQCKNLGVLWMFSFLFRFNKLVKFAFLKKVLVRVFFMKKYFSAENVFVFQLFLHITLFFYKHSVFFFLVRLSILMIFLSWALYYAYKICSNSCGHSKSTYALMEGRGGTPKTCEEGGLPKVYVIHILLRECFHISTAYFCF